jgi:hypothetical protein
MPLTKHQLFELTEMSEKPEVFGAYMVIDEDGEVYKYFYDMEGWSTQCGDAPMFWFKPVSNIKSGSNSFIQYHPDMILPDGIYNGKYNKEPCVIRIHGGQPVYISFIGFINAEGENKEASIFSPKGILSSSVEILLKSQVVTEK